MPLMLGVIGSGFLFICWFYSRRFLLFFTQHQAVFSYTFVGCFMTLFVAIFLAFVYFKTKNQLVKYTHDFEKNRAYMNEVMQTASERLRNVIQENNRLTQQIQFSNKKGLEEKLRLAQQLNKKLSNEKKRILRDLKNCRVRIKKSERRINPHSDE